MAKNIMLYEGAVRKLYAEGIHLEKETVVPMVRKEIIKDNSLYYYSFGNYINMDFDVLLPTEEEAMDYLNHVIHHRHDMIVDYLSDPKYSDEERQALLRMLSSYSACVYYDILDIHPLMEITKKEFKELRKTLQLERRNKEGN